MYPFKQLKQELLYPFKHVLHPIEHSKIKKKHILHKQLLEKL